MTGPTIPMETILAPRTESPPCARNRAWNRSTIAHTTDVIQGPNEMAESPVPVGGEQLPETEERLKDDRMEMNTYHPYHSLQLPAVALTPQEPGSRPFHSAPGLHQL